MKLFVKTIVSSLFFLFAWRGEAQNPFEELALLEGEAYVEARQRLVDSVRRERLAERVEKAAWSERSWREDAVAAFVWLAASGNDAEDRLSSLPGLDPARYLLRRRPEPTALPDLERAMRQGQLSALQLAEIWQKTFFRVRFADVEDFPADKREEARALMQEAPLALRDGILWALGRADHPLGAYLLRDVVRDPAMSDRHRAVAASALGRTRASFAFEELEALVDSKRPTLREAAVVGFGRLASARAVQRLAAWLEDGSQPDLRVPLFAALVRACAGQAAPTTPSSSSAKTEACGDAARALVRMVEVAASGRELRALLEATSALATPELRASVTRRIDSLPPGAVQDRYRDALRRVDLALSRAATSRR